MAEPARNYDDDQSETPIYKPDLRPLDGGGKTTERKKGHLRDVSKDADDTSDEDTDSNSSKSLSSEQLAEAESSSGTTEQSEVSRDLPERLRRGDGKLAQEPSGKFVFTPDKPALTSKKKKRAFLFAGGSAGLLLIGAAAVVLFLLNGLKLQDLASHVAEYNLARIARTDNQTVGDLISERFAIDGADQSVLGNLKSSASDFFDQFDRFRPAKIIDNLKGSEDLQFVYNEVPRDGLLGKLVGGTKLELDAVRIKGTDIPIPDHELGHLLANTNSDINFSADLQGALAEAYPDAGVVVRSQVAQQIREDIGIGTLSWWQNGAATYRGLSRVDAFKQEQQDAYTQIHGPPAADPLSPDNSDTAKQASDEVDKSVQDGTASELSLANVEAEGAGSPAADAIVPTAQTALENSFQQTAGDTLKTALKSQALLAQIAMPVCIVYDGSVVKSGNTIDAKSKEAQKEYYALEMAADQQKSGQTTSEAVGAMNDKLGNISVSIPELRASGQATDTSGIYGPGLVQTGSTGAFNIVNTLFGSGTVQNFVANSAGSVCPKILSFKSIIAQVAIGKLLEGVADFFSGGGATAGEEATAEAANAAADATATEIGNTVAENVATQVGQQAGQVVTTEAQQTLLQTLREKAWSITQQFGKDLVKYGGLSLLARLDVIDHMNQTYNGLSTNTSFANEADMGANLNAQDQMRMADMGAPMTASDVMSSDKADVAFLDGQHAKESVGQRYFAIRNPDSLVSKLGFATLGQLQILRFNLPNLLSGFMKQIGSVLSGSSFSTALGFGHNQYVAAAAGTQKSDYGIVQWGWTETELATIRNNATYNPANNAAMVGSDQQTYQAISNTYGKCFSETMGNLLADQDIQRNDDGSVVPDKGLCSPDNLGLNNRDSNSPCGPNGCGDKVFRWRLSLLNQNQLGQLLGIQDPSSSPSTSTASSPSNKNIYVVGDSLTIGMSGAGLAQKLAAAGWALTDDPVEATTGINVANSIPRIQTKPAEVSSAGTILVGLGTNNCVLYVSNPSCMSTADFEGQITSMVNALRVINPTAQIYWTNIYTTKGPVYDSINQALAADSTKLNYKVIDWAGEVAANPSKYNFESNLGVHQTTSQGYSNMADFVVGALQ